MKREIKEKWINALRSGEYKQGKRCLQTVSGNFCCLGVLTDLYHKETGKGTWDGEDEIDGILFREFVASNGLPVSGDLPAEVMEWAGLGNDDGSCITGTLMYMNDGTTHMPSIINGIESCSFEEIADYIEEHL